jgi:1,4-dihydroxy-2-naphthoate octaprenyltransferase
VIAPAPATARIWLLAVRPATLPAAIVPVLVGTAVATRDQSIAIGPAIAALLAALLIQIGANLANDYFDFRKGADTAERIGPTRVTQAGLVAPTTVLRATTMVLGAAGLIGVYLAYVGGWPIVAIGVVSIVCAVAYTGGPFPLGYHGLGDLFVFVFFGVVAVAGSAYLQTGTVNNLAVIASIPIALLVTAILVVNNLRDIETDRFAGKRTLAVRIGARATRWQYVAMLALAYAIPVAMAAVGGASPGWLVACLAGPLAIALVRSLRRAVTGPDFNRILKRTGQHHLLFGLLFAVGTWL